MLKWLESLKGKDGCRRRRRDRHRTDGTGGQKDQGAFLRENLIYDHASVPGNLGATQIGNTDHPESWRIDLAQRLAPEL